MMLFENVIDLKKYAPVPFWSWNNELNDEEIKKQIKQMHDVGFGGFIIHARTGLKTEYLSESWFHYVETAIIEAEKFNMCVWIYDEFGFPSGFAGGKLLEIEEYRAPFLVLEKSNKFDNSSYVSFIKEDNKYKRVFENLEEEKTYYNIYLKKSPSEVDILNPLVVDNFISLTHEKYYSKFAKYFGNVIRGFFTDEPQYYRYATPISLETENAFIKLYKEDLKEGLINLFIDDESSFSFREKYYSLMNKLYTENYYKKIYDWCSSHNVELTGHSVEEPHLFSQMWGGASVMPSYVYSHIPGIDHLCRTMDGIIDEIQVDSVSCQFDRKQVLSESFACSGFDADFRILKYVADYQMALGVNYFVFHLMNYSIQGQGVQDYPPTFSSHAPWWNNMKDFNKYLTNVGYLLANSTTNIDVLVIEPMSDIYLTYDRKKDYESVKEVEEDFKSFTEYLTRNLVSYHYGNDYIIKNFGHVSNGKAYIKDKGYSYVVLPKTRNISKDTYKFLKDFIDNGGKLCVLDNPKYLDGIISSDISLQGNISLFDVISKTKMPFEIDEKTDIIFRHFKNNDGLFTFVVNKSDKDIANIGIKTNYQIIDFEDNLNFVTEKVVLKPHESILLKKTNNIISTKKINEYKNITNNFNLCDISDNQLIVDFASYSFDNIVYSKKMYFAQIVDDLVRSEYKGKLYVKYEFNYFGGQDLRILFENDNIINILFNNNKVDSQKSNYDIKFREVKLENIKNGINEIIFEFNFYENSLIKYAIYGEGVSEALRNMISYDTHIEPIFVYGKFNIGSKNEIISQVLPVNFSNITEYGYKFFCGEFTLIGNINCESDLNIQILGNYMSADFYVNNKFSASSVMNNIIKLKTGVKKVNNEIKIVVKSSMRNLYGPHHFKGMQDWWGITPFMFSFSGMWKNGVPDEFVNDYSVVPFGIKEIKIIR